MPAISYRRHFLFLSTLLKINFIFSLYSYTFVILYRNMANKSEKRVMVAVKDSIRDKVAKKVAGTPTTIGEFFEEAAKEKLKPIKKV